MKIDKQEVKEYSLIFTGVMFLTMGVIKIISYL